MIDMKKSSMYNNGLYGCLREELEEVINDLNNDEDLFVVSVKTVSGMTLYSLPGTLTRCKKIMEELVSSIENKEVCQLGVTWVNTEHIITARMCKYIPKEQCDYYE